MVLTLMLLKKTCDVEAAYSEHVTALSVALNDKVKDGLLESTDGQSFAFNNSLEKRTNKITQAQQDSSITRAEECKRDIPWQVGSALKRVSCLNNAWNDYTVFVESYVDEPKSFRAGLAGKE